MSIRVKNKDTLLLRNLAHLCSTGTGQVEVPAGQVNFRGSLPRAASNVLKPMFHPDIFYRDIRNSGVQQFITSQQPF